jgi:hypothetical protein
LVNRESRIRKEPKQEVGRLWETCEPAIHLDTSVVGSCRGGSVEKLFDMAIAPLFGMHVRPMTHKWESYATAGPLTFNAERLR